MQEHIERMIIEILENKIDRTLTGFMTLKKFRDIAEGDKNWFFAKPPDRLSNVLLLKNINDDCINAFNDLGKAGVITIRSTLLMVASQEGIAYNLPVFSEKAFTPDRMFWMPMIVNQGPEFDRACRRYGIRPSGA